MARSASMIAAARRFLGVAGQTASPIAAYTLPARSTGTPHHHLALLAVRPDRQGLGTGTALLRSYHEMLDNGPGAPAYLEASDRRTRRIYLRHGYADRRPPIQLPGGPRMYPMWRAGQPRGL